MESSAVVVEVSDMKHQLVIDKLPIKGLFIGSESPHTQHTPEPAFFLSKVLHILLTHSTNYCSEFYQHKLLVVFQQHSVLHSCMHSVLSVSYVSQRLQS